MKTGISKTGASHWGGRKMFSEVLMLEVFILQLVEKMLNNISEDRRLLHSKTRNQKKKNKEI